jgi:hypothetical protein
MNQQLSLRDQFERAAGIVAVTTPPFGQVLARRAASTTARRPRRALVVAAAALAVVVVAVVVPLTIGRGTGAADRSAAPLGSADAAWRQAATVRARGLGVRVDAVLYAGAVSGSGVLIVRSGNAMTPLLAVGSNDPTNLKLAPAGSTTAHRGLSAWAFSSTGELDYFVYCPTCADVRNLALSAAPHYAPDGSLSRTWTALHLVGGFTAGTLNLADIADPAIRFAATGGYELDSVPWAPAVDPLPAWYDAATMQAIATGQNVQLTAFNSATLAWAGRIANPLPPAARPSATTIADICETFASLLNLVPSQLTVTALWAGTLQPTGDTKGVALLITIPGGATFQVARESGGPTISIGTAPDPGPPSEASTTRAAGPTNPASPSGGVAGDRYGLVGVFARSVSSANAAQLPVPWIDPMSLTAANTTIDVVAPGAATVRLVRSGPNTVLATSNVDAAGLATFPHTAVARTLLQQPGAILAESYDGSGRLVGATPLVGPHANDPFDDARLLGAGETIPPS